jgi:hypothetical protein
MKNNLTKPCHCTAKWRHSSQSNFGRFVTELAQIPNRPTPKFENRNRMRATTDHNDLVQETALTTNLARRTAARSQAALDEEMCEWCRSELLKHEQGLFSLTVKGRPDLTCLKATLLYSGGKLFQRNDMLSAELPGGILS